MEVIDGQEISLSGLEPAFGGTGLTLRAMAVAAGVIGDRVRVALLTEQPRAAELGGSAAFDPVTSSNSVVLPEPFGPIMPTIPGFSTVKSAVRRKVGVRSSNERV
jgi:hypothetical protein